MSAWQTNALTENPNKLALTEVASYQRRINASLERVWENVYDWEHLPWLHDSTFESTILDESGDWGWRTQTLSAGSSRAMRVELCVDLDNSRYVARSYNEDTQISEIWTYLKADAADTLIDVRFQVPDVPPSKREKLGQIYQTMYTQLWDEDERMMTGRQQRLDERIDAPRTRKLGTEAEVRANLPMLIQLGRREYRLLTTDNNLVIHASVCPHLLGPLSSVEIKNGCVSCPWHGYRFDVASGKCLTAGHESLHLPAAPAIDIDPDTTEVTVSLVAI